MDVIASNEASRGSPEATNVTRSPLRHVDRRELRRDRVHEGAGFDSRASFASRRTHVELGLPSHRTRRACAKLWASFRIDRGELGQSLGLLRIERAASIRVGLAQSLGPPSASPAPERRAPARERCRIPVSLFVSSAPCDEDGSAQRACIKGAGSNPGASPRGASNGTEPRQRAYRADALRDIGVQGRN
nr:MAG: hypothetical protein DIU78_02260 [Pseudomonadota bacterium]